MDRDTISVVMATYNGSEFLTEQLDTIREQTLPPDELIILDDLSTDNTVEVAREYIQKHNLSDKWHVYVNENNLGYANNFNKVASMANCDLIFFSDQDDTWKLNKIQIMSDIMSEHPDCQVLCTDYFPWYTGENAPEAPKSVLKRMPDNGELEKIVLSKRSVYIGALGCCMCVRRNFYKSIEKYWFDGWAQDDRMWKLSQCVDGCMLLHLNLINHRIHANNTSTYGKYHTIEKRVKLFSEMKKAYKEMLLLLENTVSEGKAVKSLKNHIKMMEKRVKLLTTGNFLINFSLLGYLGLYERKKSYLVETYMAVKHLFLND